MNAGVDTPAIDRKTASDIALSTAELAAVREMLDRDAIARNMVKYTRALDRYDPDRVKDAYWPDAIDDHGGFVGNAHAFADHVYAEQKNGVLKSCSHLIGNMQVEFVGPTRAQVEFAFMAVAVFNDPDGEGDRDFITVGRYRDLYEKRGGDWKILNRTVIWDWSRDELSAGNWQRWLRPDCTNFGKNYPDDQIYGRW